MSEPIPIVQIHDGSLRGRSRYGRKGATFFSFEGIPYGEPPVGALRFKAPVPVKPWDGIKDALSIKSGNTAKDVVLTEGSDGKPKIQWVTSGSEDCLDLNVYTRSLPSESNNKLRPVMVFIHGGGFSIGNTRHYSPVPLMTEDIVLVTIHYRLGALGFLVIDDPKLGVTGNAGLKDMVLALKWVRRNIKFFCGDPENVTIFGESAGSAAVNYLILSPSASGLFHKAILQSGTVLNYWSLAEPKYSKKLAEALGHAENDDPAELLEFLQSVPAEKLYEAQITFDNICVPSTRRYFAPVIENEESENPFLTEEPTELLNSGNYNQVPIIIGYNDMEAIFFLWNDPERPMNLKCIGDDTLVPAWLNLQKNDAEYGNVLNRVKKFYFGNDEPELYSVANINCCSDINFIRGVIKTAQLMQKSSKFPVYLYRFSSPVIYDEPLKSLQITGVPHAAELFHLFNFSFLFDVKHLNGNDEIISERFLKLWTSFAKFDNPTLNKDELITLNWDPLENLNVLDIGDELKMIVAPEKERMEFWDEIFKEFPHAEDY